jgi:hypothetical protein
MKILFKYPTRGRPLKFFRSLDRYYELMTGSNFEFVISIDGDDETMNNHEVTSLLSRYQNLSFIVGNSKNKIEAINADLSGKDFDILVLVSDDMIPEINGFDDIIRAEMEKNYPDRDGVLWFFDGWRRDLNTLCILGKNYYDRFGYIYHPAYKSFWCDTEFTEVANMLEKQVFIDNVIIRHLHPDVVMQDKNAFTKFNEILPEFVEHKSFGHDATWQKNSLPGDPDKDVYQERRFKNFDLEQ